MGQTVGKMAAILDFSQNSNWVEKNEKPYAGAV